MKVCLKYCTKLVLFRLPFQCAQSLYQMDRPVQPESFQIKGIYIVIEVIDYGLILQCDVHVESLIEIIIFLWCMVLL